MPVIQHPPAHARPLARALLLLGLFSGGACLIPAEASAAGRSPTPPERAATTWTAGESEPAQCSHTRRKLWQAGEGWTVKRVTVCR